MTKNPADDVDAPRVRTEEVHPLAQEEARRFLEAVRGDRLEALYVVALHTGLRQGELLALRCGKTWTLKPLRYEDAALSRRTAASSP
jgi:integrase